MTPADVRGRTVVKIVYVVLEAQYQSALSQAVQSINKNNDKVWRGEERRGGEGVEGAAARG